MSNQGSDTTRGKAFVDYIFQRMGQDTGVKAKLRRADNPNLEYQAWEILAGFHVNLENKGERLAFATVASAAAKSKAEHNGKLGFGAAVAKCYDDGHESDQAKAKLRRLLATSNVEEACRVLRHLISLIHSRVAEPLDYGRLLDQILSYRFDDERIKAQWAQEFYRKSASTETEAS